MTDEIYWPQSEPYLILHKVRGEPAFDVAVQMHVECESDPGPWWVIPTSGHRAYPCLSWKLTDLYTSYLCSNGSIDNWRLMKEVGPIESSPEFAALRDHYAAELTPIVPLNLSFASKTPLDRRF